MLDTEPGPRSGRPMLAGITCLLGVIEVATSASVTARAVM